ncbi:hypothetical protein AcV5_004300 [Taiwanofungus camphoratus]|nr:hypothetical protein AcV5_004300 [Antrodia cinnamomea]
MSSLSSAVANLLSALTSIAANLANSVLAVLQAILALAQHFVGGLLQLAKAFVDFGTSLFQGVLGFVAANFVAILLVGGAYYWYTNYYRGGSRWGSQKETKKIH